MTNFRFVLAVIGVPTLTAIFGLLWLWDRKKKKKRLQQQRKESTDDDEALSQLDDCWDSKDGHPYRKNFPATTTTTTNYRLKYDVVDGNDTDVDVDDDGYDDDDDGGDALLCNVEGISKRVSHPLTNSSSHPNYKLKSDEMRQLNGRRDVSPGQHVDACITAAAAVAAVEDAALCYQVPGKHGDCDGGGRGKIVADRNLTNDIRAPHISGIHLQRGDVCSEAVAVGSITHTINATLHSAVVNNSSSNNSNISCNDQNCTNKGEDKVASLLSSDRDDSSESSQDRNHEEVVVVAAQNFFSDTSHGFHGDKDLHDIDDDNQLEGLVGEAVVLCEPSCREEGVWGSCVWASEPDNLSSAAVAGSGHTGSSVSCGRAQSGSKGRDSELSDTWRLSGSSEFDRNKSGGHGGGGGADDLLRSEVQVNVVSSNTNSFGCVDNDSIEVTDSTSSVQVGEVTDDSVTQVGSDDDDDNSRKQRRDKVNVDSYSQMRSLDAISAVFSSSSNPLDDSDLKVELECLRGPVTATNTSTPKRENGAGDNLLQSAKELFHETKSITPPETESDKDGLTDSMESDDPVVVNAEDEEDSPGLSTSEDGPSDGSGGDVYLSSLSQSPPFRHRKRKENEALIISANKSPIDVSSLSPANDASFETARCKSEGSSGAECATAMTAVVVEEELAGSKCGDADSFKTVDSLDNDDECRSQPSPVHVAAEQTACSVSSGEGCRSVEVYGSSFKPGGIGAVDTSSFGSSDQDADEISCGHQLQSDEDDNNSSGGGHDEMVPGGDSNSSAAAVISSNAVCGESALTDAGQTGAALAEKKDEGEEEKEEGKMVYDNLVDNSANCDDATDHSVTPQDGGETDREIGSGSKLEYSAATFSPESNYHLNYHSNSTLSCDFTNPQCDDNNVTNPTSNTIYEFYFPSDLCGRLIGRQGKTISQIKERSGAYLTLQPSPYTPNHQICSIDGSEEEIQEALKCITEKFPPSVYGNVDLTPIRDTPQLATNPVVMPDLIQLNLPQEGVSVNVLVASIIDAGHIFLQLPTHPTYVALNRLDKFMNRCYSQPGMVPHLPRPLAVGVICAAPVMDSWYRAVIVAVSEDTDECEIKFVDYGGYNRVSWNDLRQIRSDFMTLPFQAVEAYLANITPLADEPYFSDAAVETLQHLTESEILQAQVVSRADDGNPYVHIYQINGNKVTFVNRELVNRNVVQWIEIL